MCLHDYIKFNNNLCSPYIYITPTFPNNVYVLFLAYFSLKTVNVLYFFILVGIRLHRSGQFWLCWLNSSSHADTVAELSASDAAAET